MTTPTIALDLLTPWLDLELKLGDPSPDPVAQLDALRATLPGDLPDDYTAVLLALNRPVRLNSNRIMAVEPPCPRIPGQFPYVGENPEFRILYDLGGGPSRSRSVPEIWDGMSDQMPKGLVPIGMSFSDEICMDVSEAGNGRIYYWWHEGDPGENDAEGYPGWGNTFLLAHSFTDLCARIAPPLPVELNEGIAKARICFSRP